MVMMIYMVESFVWWCSSSWRYWYWYFVSLGTPPDTPRHTHTHTHTHADADAETPGVTHVGGKCFQFNSSNDGHINWSPALGVWSCKGSILYPKETNPCVCFPVLNRIQPPAVYYKMLFALSFSSVYLFCFELYSCLLCAGMTQILKTAPPESLWQIQLHYSISPVQSWFF